MARRYDGKPETPEYETGPPLAVDFLAEQISIAKEEMSKRHRKWPAEIPAVANAAAEWWMTKQKPGCPHSERCYQVTAIGGGNRWECPYHLRISASFRAYISLPDIQRDIIHAALEDGVWWNGDEVMKPDGSPGIFIRICDETMKMKENPQEYIKNAKLLARQYLSA